MNALKLSLLDSVLLSAADLAAPVPAVPVRTGIAPLANQPDPLWRQSLAEHEPAARALWAVRGVYALLGTLSVGSIIYAASVICHGMVAHDGLHAAVQALMGR